MSIGLPMPPQEVLESLKIGKTAFVMADPASIARKTMETLKAMGKGTVCVKCKEDFPYAEARPKFTCWDVPMSPVERLLALRSIIREMNIECERLTVEISKFCTHPCDHRRSLPWEHDDGYGTQTMLQGWQCGLCGEYIREFTRAYRS